GSRSAYRGGDEARDDQLGSEVAGESTDLANGVGESRDAPHGIGEESGAVIGSDAGRDASHGAGEGNEAQNTEDVAGGSSDEHPDQSDAGSSVWKAASDRVPRGRRAERAPYGKHGAKRGGSNEGRNERVGGRGKR